MTTGATKVVGIIGWPVEGSLSPTIHGAAFQALGLDWAYVPLPVEPDDLPAALAGLPALGLRGASVTMPHKTRTAGLVDRRSDDAETLRAVNTIVVTDDGLVGHNTDAPGFERWLREDLAFDDELPIVMTEKDAVKCMSFAQPGWWQVPASACFSGAQAEAVRQWLDGLLADLKTRNLVASP